MDAAEYKHVVLGLIFLKYISDAFEEGRGQLETERGQVRTPKIRTSTEPRALLGGARGALAEAPIPGPPVRHWTGRGRRHDRHRAGQSGPQGRAAQRLRPPGAGQDPPGAGGRPCEQHQDGRGRSASHGRAGQRLRVLPGAVRPGRGQEGRRVLHAAKRRTPPRRDARALPGPGLRPLLRLIRQVRPVGGVHPRPRQRQRERW